MRQLLLEREVAARTADLEEAILRGHDAGDDALRRVAAGLRSSLRSIDLPVRWELVEIELRSAPWHPASGDVTEQPSACWS